MANKPGYFIGLDIGTSSTKAVAFDELGRAIGEKAIPYPTQSPQPGWSEQSPAVVAAAAFAALRRLAANTNGQVLGIGISGAMHSLIALDSHDEPLTQAILWSDTRSATIAAALKSSDLGQRIYRHTGTPIHAMSPLPKLAWLRHHLPTVSDQAACFLGLKEYLLLKLVGEKIMDFSIAAATGLFDAHRLDWYGEALDFADTAADQLPILASPFTQIPLTKTGAKLTGLPVGTPIVIGASDGCLANLGAGAFSPGDAVLSIGTSGALRVTTQKAVPDARQRIFTYLLFDRSLGEMSRQDSGKTFIVGGASNNGAVVYNWFARQFFGCSPASKQMDRHKKAMEATPTGAEGLLFLPYLHGERAPIWDANAKAAFFGGQPHHTGAHFHRAVLEGILLNMALIGEALSECTGQFHRILANGGFTNMPFWVQMAADIFGKEVHLSKNEGGPALGAAALAATVLGYDGLAMIQQASKSQRAFLPNPAHAEVYGSALQAFRAKAFSLVQP